MTQEETRLKEIEEQIESLKKERTALKEKISSVNDDANFTRMLSRVEMKVAFGNVLFIYCSDDEGLEHYDSYQNHTDGTYKFMSDLIGKIAKKLGNPKYYDLKDKFQKPYSVINGIFVIAIGVCIFLYSFLRDVGAIGGASSLLILGLMYFFLPFPPEIMIHKYKLKKSILITKIIAGVIFVLGLIVLIFYLTHII